MKKLIVFFLAFLFFLFACYLTPALKIYDIAPDFVLLLLAALMPYCGVMTLLPVAAVMGVFLDTTLSGGLYFNTVIYLLSALAFGIFRSVLPKNPYFSTPIALISAVVIRYFISMFALYVMSIHPNISILYFLKAVPTALYNVVLVFPLVFLFAHLFAWKRLQEKEEPEPFHL